MPTELHRIGKSEEFLENAIVQTPKLLCLESRRTGIREPFVAFQQLPLTTPTGRVVFPDIIFLSASGHVIVVEVKLSINQVLRQRDVVAQIIDYASSLSRLDENGLCKLFDREGNADKQWFSFIEGCFPTQPTVDELAAVFLHQIARGHVNIVIACDKIPPGTAEMVSSVSTQAAHGFECDVVEIVPFVREERVDAELMLVPSIRLSTEIVARTSVVVTYRTGDAKPEASVQVTSANEIADTVGGINSGLARNWAEDEVAAAIEQSNDPVQSDLFLYAKTHSDDGQVVTEGLKQNASFGLHLRSSSWAGLKRRCIFSCPVPWRTVTIFLGAVESLFPEEVVVEFRSRLTQALGSQIDCSKPAPGIRTDRLAGRLDQFKSALDWLVSQPR